MTASVTNKQFNNLEEMFSVVKETAERTDATINKAAKDFEKVFDKSVDKVKKAEEQINNENDYNVKNNTVAESINDLKKSNGIEKKYNDVVKDIKKIVEQCADTDLKSVLKDKINTILSNTEISEQWVEFREVLNEIVSEANVETSLDLTLAKDINEIISQLKEAVENTAETLENIENNLQAALNSDVNIDTQGYVSEDVAESVVTSQNADDGEVLTPFEQILTFYDKSVKSEFMSQENSINNTDKTLVKTDVLEQEQAIDLVENLVDEVATDKSNEKVATNETEFLIDEDVLKELKIESMQAETNTASGDDFMQKQTPEEVSIKALINKDVEVFDIKVEKAQSVQQAQMAQVSQTKSVEINPSRILDQITKQMEGLQSGSKVNIVLNPESLGKVNIQLLTTKEGLMAQLTVTTQEAKDILMKGLDGLKESLLAQGVGVDNVSVKVADAQKSEYNQDWTEQDGSRGGNKGQKNPDREEKEKGAFEKMMAENLEKENGNV